MTPLQMAQSECANIIDGECLLTGGKCVLARGERCRYFETTILPLAALGDHYERYAGMAEAYTSRTAGAPQLTDASRRCECGASLAPRKRMCAACRSKSRRLSARDAQNKRRRSP